MTARQRSPFDDTLAQDNMMQTGVRLEHILAGVRKTESGSYRGRYGQTGPRVGGDVTFGAYNVMRRYWGEWTSLAGIPGASMQSPEAQDIVAGYVISTYYERYGDWNLAAMAWYAGPEQVAKVVRRGYSGTDSIQNPKIREYVNNVAAAAEVAYRDPVQAYVSSTPRLKYAFATPVAGWIMPVAGASEYSNSFTVPRDNRYGIHGAIDVYAKTGTPIVAPVAGKVTSVQSGGKGGYTVSVLGDDGITYYFAHMDTEAVVGRGDKVRAGEHLGFVGSSGNAQGTSPHLHFSMKKNGNPINPYTQLQKSEQVGTWRSMDAEDAMVQEAPYSMRNTMNSWMQDLSYSVANGIPSAPEAPDAPDAPDELDDKRMQTESITPQRTSAQEQRMV